MKPLSPLIAPVTRWHLQKQLNQALARHTVCQEQCQLHSSPAFRGSPEARYWSREMDAAESAVNGLMGRLDTIRAASWEGPQVQSVGVVGIMFLAVVLPLALTLAIYFALKG